MILFWEDIEKRYKTYSNIKTKVGREVKKGALIPLKKGVYTDDASADPIVFANAIYSPSYISFQSALFFYGLISKKPSVTLSATRNKNRHKKFVNTFGEFIYQDLPSKVYQKGTIYAEVDAYTIFIASKEKAICDTLYLTETILSLKELKKYLFETLGIDQEEFWKLNLEFILTLCPLYKSRTLSTLEHLIEKRLGIVRVKKKKTKKLSKKSKAKDAWDALAALRNKYGDN